MGDTRRYCERIEVVPGTNIIIRAHRMKTEVRRTLITIRTPVPSTGGRRVRRAERVFRSRAPDTVGIKSIYRNTAAADGVKEGVRGVGGESSKVTISRKNAGGRDNNTGTTQCGARFNHSANAPPSDIPSKSLVYTDYLITRRAFVNTNTNIIIIAIRILYGGDAAPATGTQRYSVTK